MTPPNDHILIHDGGSTSVEYSLIAALVAVTITGAVLVYGAELVILYEDVGTKVEDAVPPNPV